MMASYRLARRVTFSSDTRPILSTRNFQGKHRGRAFSTFNDSMDRRIVSRIHEVIVDMIDQRAVLLRLGFHFLPFRIVMERLPVLFRFRAAGMLQDIDKQIL